MSHCRGEEDGADDGGRSRINGEERKRGGVMRAKDIGMKERRRDFDESIGYVLFAHVA